MKREIKCPHAKNCWLGGGSYDCAYDPPFCETPALPKNSDDWKKLELPRMVKEPEENKGGGESTGEMKQVLVIQQELF